MSPNLIILSLYLASKRGLPIRKKKQLLILLKLVALLTLVAFPALAVL